MKARTLSFLFATALVLLVSVATACTIPVFRYALERWEADRLLVVVYHRGPLSADDESAVQSLANRSTLAGGPLNIEVLRFDIASPPENPLDLKEPTDRPLPWVELRSRQNMPQTLIRWQGTLSQASTETGVFDSPARQELVRRLMDGDSGVWLLIAPQGQEHKLADELTKKLEAVKPELVLPAGIGQPGSELYAPIPLEIKFSVLAVSHADAAEQHFLAQLASTTKDWQTEAAYVVPVFGRLRALEVIPHGEVDDFVVRDISEFLCAACSCRVKQANPGFDLVASINWHTRLFGDAPAPPVEETTPPLASAAPSEMPQYVLIPSGPTPALSPAQESTDAVPPKQDSPTPYILAALLTLAACAIGAVFAFQRRR